MGIILKLLALATLSVNLYLLTQNYFTPGYYTKNTNLPFVIFWVILNVSILLRGLAVKDLFCIGAGLFTFLVISIIGATHWFVSSVAPSIENLNSSFLEKHLNFSLNPGTIEHIFVLVSLLVGIIILFLVFYILVRTSGGISNNISLSFGSLIPSRPKLGDFPICTDIKTGKQVIVRQHDMYEHCFILGPPGSGKSAAVLKGILVKAMDDMQKGLKCSITLIEPKGDLVQWLKNYCQQKGIPCICIDPLDPDTDKINIMEGEEYSVAENIRSILSNLFYGQEQFFAQAQETHAKKVVYLMKRLRGNSLTLLDLIRVLRDVEELKECVNQYASNKNHDRDLVAYFNKEAFGRLQDKLHQFAQGLRLQLEDLTDNKFLQNVMSGKSSIDIHHHLEHGGGVLCINTEMGKLKKLGDKFGQFMVQYVMNAVFERPGNENSRIPHYFIVDEFKRYLNPEIERLTSVGRSYRTACILAVQGLDQLHHKNFPTLKNELLSTTATQIYFKGMNAEDAETVSKLMGEKEKEQISYGYNRDSLIHLPIFENRRLSSERFKRRFDYTYLRELPKLHIAYIVKGKQGELITGIGKVKIIGYRGPRQIFFEKLSGKIKLSVTRTSVLIKNIKNKYKPKYVQNNDIQSADQVPVRSHQYVMAPTIPEEPVSTTIDDLNEVPNPFETKPDHNKLVDLPGKSNPEPPTVEDIKKRYLQVKYLRTSLGQETVQDGKEEYQMVDYRIQMTEREHSVYKYICNSIESNGYPPTLREICTALDIKSPMTVSKCLESLENVNLITRKPNAFRGITLNESKKKNNIPLYEEKTMTRIGSVTLQNGTSPPAGRALLVTKNSNDDDKNDTDKKSLIIRLSK